MEVLVKDLCKPDVLAAIAKRRFFSIKDKPNMTPEIWEKFRDMISSVHHTQPVDPNELEAKLRDCPPRSSEPPKPEDPWPEGYETPGRDPPEVRAERHKIEAEEVYDTLIQIGGRPTRPIRPIPPWKKVFIQGDLCYRYAEEIEVLFYSSWHGNDRGLHSTLTEADYIAAHWAAECSQFREELRRWQEFLHDQQWRREHRPEFAREEEIERLRYPQDPHVTASLKKVKDWKEYLVYFQRTIDVSKKRIEAARRAVEAIQRKDPEVVLNKGEVRRLDKRDWLDIIEREREHIAAEEKRLEWVKQQLPAVLSECTASLTGAPTACREMQERSELEAKRVFNTLVETGGRPTRPMQPVPCNQEREDTDNPVHVLCHWEAECSQFEEELREWRKFLDHRQKKEADEVTVEEQQAAETTTQVVLWKDYRAYQQMEVDHAKQWVKFSQQMKLHVEYAQKQVRSAEMRLEWVERQLSALLAERAVSTTAMSTFNSLEDQAKLHKRASRSGQTTLKNPRANRINKSGPRSNHDEKGTRVSARVSKPADKKAPRRRRQSMMLAEHGDCQDQGPSTTMSPLLPPDVTPRRSSRLSNNEKRSGALEASLAVELGKSAHSPPIVLRRSDRLSKQKERLGASASTTAVDSAVISQADMLQHPFRFKSEGRRTGNKSDTRSVKPRGISKRQNRRFSRNRTRICS